MLLAEAFSQLSMTTYSPAMQKPWAMRSATQNHGTTRSGGRTATTETMAASRKKLRRDPTRRSRPGATREPARKPT